MSKFNLVESQFDLNHSFEAAVLCTYGLDLNFLENYLMQLRGLAGCDTIVLFVDAATYEAFASGRYIPRYLNRRYLVTPVWTTGVFHTKLYILASSRKAVVTIGSANLSREGIAGNLELLSTFEVSEAQDEFVPLLREALGYARRLAELSGSQQAIDQVDIASQVCAPLTDISNEQKAVRLIHNLDRPILDAILNEIGDEQVRRVHVLSPFYDTDLAPLTALQERLPGCAIEFHIQQGKSNFPTKHLALSPWPFAIDLYHELDRYLHGKAIILEGDTNVLVYTGSANFTRPALLTTALQGNFEIGLLGRASSLAVHDLLRPLGVQPVAIHSANEIKIDDRTPPRPIALSQVNYIIEAVLENGNVIHIRKNPGISADEFRPLSFRLRGFGQEGIVGSYDPGKPITLNKRAHELCAGACGINLIGVNGRGEDVESNLVWVIALQELPGSVVDRALRRVARDPSQLMEVLQTIDVRGDEREMILFLAQFDILLDLIPATVPERPRNLRSQGNLVGRLPIHRKEFFSSLRLKAFDECISRLLKKMRRHCQNVQPSAARNFVALYVSVLSLLTYLNEWAMKRYEGKVVISAEDWLMIRDCYDMLTRHTATTWNLVWAKDGYRNAVNAKLELLRADEDWAERFEDHLLAYYNNLPEQFADVLEAPFNTFDTLSKRLQVSTPQGLLVQPKIFPTAHPDLQPEPQALWKERLQRTRQQLSSRLQPLVKKQKI